MSTILNALRRLEEEQGDPRRPDGAPAGGDTLVPLARPRPGPLRRVLGVALSVVVAAALGAAVTIAVLSRVDASTKPAPAAAAAITPAPVVAATAGSPPAPTPPVAKRTPPLTPEPPPTATSNAVAPHGDSGEKSPRERPPVTVVALPEKTASPPKASETATTSTSRAFVPSVADSRVETRAADAAVVSAESARDPGMRATSPSARPASVLSLAGRAPTSRTSGAASPAPEPDTAVAPPPDVLPESPWDAAPMPSPTQVAKDTTTLRDPEISEIEPVVDRRETLSPLERAIEAERREALVAATGIEPPLELEPDVQTVVLGVARDSKVETVVRTSVPEVVVRKTVWHPRANRREVFVDVMDDAGARSMVLHEGDAVGPLVLEEIRPSGATFLHNGVEIRRRVGGGS